MTVGKVSKRLICIFTYEGEKKKMRLWMGVGYAVLGTSKIKEMVVFDPRSPKRPSPFFNFPTFNSLFLFNLMLRCNSLSFFALSNLYDLLFMFENSFLFIDKMPSYFW